MKSFTSIQKYTPAVLKMVCRQKGISKKKLRLGTLKRVDTELGNLLDPGVADLHPDLRESLTDLHNAVRLAIGDE